MKVGTGTTSMKLTLMLFILGLSTTILSAADEEIKITHAVQKVIELDEQLAQISKALGKNFQVAEKITKFLGTLGPAFDAVSALFSLASIFLPKPDSQELQPIKDLKKQIDKRFDRIEEQLKGMKDLIQELSDKEPVRYIVNSFQDNYVPLKVLEELSMSFLTYPTEQRKNEFIEECKANKALYMVKWIEEHLKPFLATDTMLFGPHIFNYLKYENVKWEAWVDYIFDAAVYASVMHFQCMAATGDRSSTELEHEKDKLTKTVSAIAERFKEATRDFHNGFKPFAKKATENSLSRNPSGSSRFKAN